jgi:hypothetical protein
VVEGARLESVCRGNSTVGSNPTLSASSHSSPPNSGNFVRFRRRIDGGEKSCGAVGDTSSKPAEYDDGFNARSRDVSRGWSPATRRKSIARIRLGQRAQPQRRFDDRRPERVRRRRRQEVACRRNEGPGRPVRVLRSFAAPVSMASTRQVPRSITGIASPESRSS